jgi:hypothetical protein
VDAKGGSDAANKAKSVGYIQGFDELRETPIYLTTILSCQSTVY